MFLRLDNFTMYVGSLVGIASGKGRASGEDRDLEPQPLPPLPGLWWEVVWEAPSLSDGLLLPHCSQGPRPWPGRGVAVWGSSSFLASLPHRACCAKLGSGWKGEGMRRSQDQFPRPSVLIKHPDWQ